MRKRTLARENCLKILYQIEILKEESGNIIENFWRDNKASEDIINFSTTLVKGIIKEQKFLDDIILKHTKNWELSRMAILDKNILRMGVYELLYMQDIPHKVTINEAVNLAKKYSQADSGKFVNGVLDHISHNEEKRYK